ncbi:MAG TPA: GGDEF domain-containing protein [Candidatus Acidoferrum sp.]|jgi:diguanylate cyclase (GGDEF)-like protein
MSFEFLWARRKPAATALSDLLGFAGILIAAYWLRGISIQADPLLQGYLQVITGLLAFVFAAVSLVRFQGTQDRISLILGVGFMVSGAVLTATSVLFFQLHDTQLQVLWAPVAWWESRMVFALLLLVALLVERFLPRSHYPKQELTGALVTVMAATYLITVSLRRLPPQASPHPGAWFPSPQQLLPGVIFLISFVWYRHRLRRESSAFDKAIYAAAWLNLAAQCAASQSERILDAPFALAQALTVMSYVVALGGALLDNARLFEKVRHLAVSDPLTGLANYRRLLDVLEKEMERSNRTGRPFSILLMDVDGLKKINDTYGHLVGSRAICRLGDVLRMNSRSVDTAARYGGDEFVLVLPEAREREAHLVALRIQEVMRHDPEKPEISASIGISTYRGESGRIEKLLSDADKNLYAQKSGRQRHTAASNAS